MLVLVAARSKAQVFGRSSPEIVGPNPTASMDVCLSVYCKCCVLSGRGLCDGLITRSEVSYRLWCVVVCDLETSWMRRHWSTGGCCAKHSRIINSICFNEHDDKTLPQATQFSALEEQYVQNVCINAVKIGFDTKSLSMMSQRIRRTV